VRALVSGVDAGKLGDLRCEVREGLIQFLCRNYPESLPRSRNVNVDDEHPKTSHRKSTGIEATPGAQHERGDKSPGVHPEAKTDGHNSDV
jgi:hypothetical protein